MHPNFPTLIYSNVTIRVTTELSPLLLSKEAPDGNLKHILAIMGDTTQVTPMEFDHCVQTI